MQTNWVYEDFTQLFSSFKNHLNSVQSVLHYREKKAEGQY